jgi:hypothetical protein
MRQTQAEYAALVCMYDAALVVGIEAIDLHVISLERSRLAHTRTRISPPCVPAKMYCDETARARIDLSCFIRCERTGVRCASGPGLSAPCVSMMSPLWGGGAVGMVSLARCCSFGVSAWSRVKVSRFGGSDDGRVRVQRAKSAGCGALVHHRWVLQLD